MAAIQQRMIDGMRANGIPDDVATRIFNQINGFADYGFPESHAASFALIVYASAYLRHYYASEFLAFGSAANRLRVAGCPVDHAVRSRQIWQRWDERLGGCCCDLSRRRLDC